MNLPALILATTMVSLPLIVEAAETYVCNVKMPSPKNDRNPTELSFELDAAHRYVVIRDNVAARPNARPVRAEIVKDTNKVLTVKWELEGLKAPRNRTATNGYGQKAQYRSTVNKRDGSLVLSVQSNPWRPAERTSGVCKRVGS